MNTPFELADGGMIPVEELVVRMPAASVAAADSRFRLFLGQDQVAQLGIERAGIRPLAQEDRCGKGEQDVAEFRQHGNHSPHLIDSGPGRHDDRRLYRARFFGHKFDLSGVLHGGFLPDETRLARAA
jgi:hypothetical protein